MTQFSSGQVQVGSEVLAAVKSLGLPPADEATAELDAIEAAEAESGIADLGYGDYPSSMGGQMSSSRGVFQQIAAWGPYADRTDVTKSTLMFLRGGQGGQRGLLDVPGWNTENSWDAVQAVQGSEFSDGSNYRAQYQNASDFVKQYGSGALSAPGLRPPGSAVSDPPAAGSSGGSSGGSGGGSGGSTKPVASPIDNAIAAFALKGLFAFTGLGLVLLGVWRMSAPVRGQVSRFV